MGRRKDRRRPTRKEKIKTVRGKRIEEIKKRPADKNPERSRRKVSPEARALAMSFAKVMGWPVERVLPGAGDMEVTHHV